ncbi:MAG TPA: radical SAM family heme chaperone HemW [Pyrinomonadaceae bacterium]|nr:radical SAM family heme chaperone HemW [Pyrinomonadaceae bacterium]
MSLAGVYLHIPFCKSRCSYCDFATDVWRDAASVERYVDAICSEISDFKSEILMSVDTIYFGGGTPSLLSPEQVEHILNVFRGNFDVTADVEITMEMNPATVTPETLNAYRELGVNRASFGVQTFNEQDLKLLARGHDANDARQTYKMLRDAGFTNISFDLIAGLPGQTLDDWTRNLDEALGMSPEHLSLYLLEIHESTPLAEQVRSGRRKPIDEEVAAEMYELMLDRLVNVGYEQYEISNFSKPGYESRHNSKYWTLDSVYGFGVSAHSFDGTQRYANVRDTAQYVEKIESGSSPEAFRENIDRESESIFLGLRLERGISMTSNQIDKYRKEIEKLAADDLLALDGNKLKLTRRGKLFSNEVFAVFV